MSEGQSSHRHLGEIRHQYSPQCPNPTQLLACPSAPLKTPVLEMSSWDQTLNEKSQPEPCTQDHAALLPLHRYTAKNHTKPGLHRTEKITHRDQTTKGADTCMNSYQ